jgi:hypothetical protein
MSDAQAIAGHLDTLGVPAPAKEWLLDIWHVIQLLDDAMDGDPVKPEAVSTVAWALFARIPTNPFYQQFVALLQPVLVLQLRKWEAANVIEAAGMANEKSYMWRAGYYDLVEMVCHLCGLQGTGHAVTEIYGETFTEYMEGL